MSRRRVRRRWRRQSRGARILVSACSPFVLAGQHPSYSVSSVPSKQGAGMFNFPRRL